HAALRRLLQAGPGGRARRALHDGGAPRPRRGRPRAGGPAARLRARCRPAPTGRAAPAPGGLLAGRAPAPRRATAEPPGAPRAGRAVRDWARAEPDRPTAYRFAARIYEDMRAFDLARDAALRETSCAPNDASAWERLGRLRLRLGDRPGAQEALERARGIAPT